MLGVELIKAIHIHAFGAYIYEELFTAGAAFETQITISCTRKLEQHSFHWWQQCANGGTALYWAF